MYTKNNRFFFQSFLNLSRIVLPHPAIALLPPQPPEPQGVQDDRDGAQRHCDGGVGRRKDDAGQREEDAGGNRDQGDVIDEGEQ